jgi:hypothetical protein
MKLLMLAAVAASVLTLAACGGQSSAAPPAASPSTSSSATPAATVAALTCKQQGVRWKAEHRVVIRRFKRSLTPFESGSVTSAQAEALTKASQAMLAAPLPACADPKGYYTQALANLATAGQTASGGGALSELGALTPMENALTALNELKAELEQAIGSGKL